ncbi:MAG TPA: DM13 domain-containing protein [Candidatus Paceibacterota bacterium]
MKRNLIILVIILVLIIGYWLISPFFINKKVSEESPLNASQQASTETKQVNEVGDSSEVKTEIIYKGTFTGFDKIHYGSGDAALIKTENGLVLRFEENFNVANGPDLYVGFGKDGKYVNGSEIARLKGNIGSQNYSLSTDFRLEEYNEVWIWCRAFSVPFAKATFEAI